MDYKNYKIEDYLEALASTKSMPGGGSASALLSANAVCLALKVCNLTIGKEQYEENEDKILDAKEKLIEFKDIFFDLMEKDTIEFKAMEDVFKMPKESADEKAKRNKAMEIACKKCCEVPKEIIDYSIEAINIINTLSGITNKSAESDLITSTIFLNAAIKGAWQNILINIKHINDKMFIANFDKYKTLIN